MAVKRFPTPFDIEPLTPSQVGDIVSRGFKLIKIRDDGWEIMVDLEGVSQVTCETAYSPGTDHSMFQIAMVIDDSAHVYRWNDDGSLSFCRVLSLESAEPGELDEEYVEIEEAPPLIGAVVGET